MGELDGFLVCGSTSFWLSANLVGGGLRGEERLVRRTSMGKLGSPSEIRLRPKEEVLSNWPLTF